MVDKKHFNEDDERRFEQFGRATYPDIEAGLEQDNPRFKTIIAAARTRGFAPGQAILPLFDAAFGHLPTAATYPIHHVVRLINELEREKSSLSLADRVKVTRMDLQGELDRARDVHEPGDYLKRRVEAIKLLNEVYADVT